MIDLYLPPKPAIIKVGEPWQSSLHDYLARHGVPFGKRIAIVSEIKRLSDRPKLLRASAQDLARFSDLSQKAMFGGFAITGLSGFGAGGGAAAPVETLVSSGTGTAIGGSIVSGALSACFDGTTSSSFSACRLNGGAYVGKTWGAGKIFSRAIVYGSNDFGFSIDSNGSITLNFYGKNGAQPSSSTDGTLIGTLSFTDTSNESAGRTINSTDTATAYLHWWVACTGFSGSVGYAELVLYELA